MRLPPTSPSALRPLYVISFDGQDPSELPSAMGLDPRIVDALPLLFAVLDLPRTGLETTARGTLAIYWDSTLEHSHSVLLVPWPWPPSVRWQFEAHHVVICLATATVQKQVADHCRNHGYRFFDPAAEGCQASIWEELRIEAAGALATDAGPPPRGFASRLDPTLRALYLTTVRALRLLEDREVPNSEIVCRKLARPPTGLPDALDLSIETRGRIQFAYDFQREHGHGAVPVESQFKDGQLAAVRALRAPLVIGTMPGPEPAVTGDADDALALEFLVAHRALSSGGFGFTVNWPAAVWQRVEDLHISLINTDPRQVGRRAGKDACQRVAAVGHALLAEGGQPLRDVLTYTSRAGGAPVYTFSDAPMEWCAVPGVPDPLCLVRPVVRRPVYPLTAAIQAELAPKDLVDLRHGLNVLCIECVATSDPLHKKTTNIADSLCEMSGSGNRINVRRLLPRQTNRWQPSGGVAHMFLLEEIGDDGRGGPPALQVARGVVDELLLTGGPAGSRQRRIDSTRYTALKARLLEDCAL